MERDCWVKEGQGLHFEEFQLLVEGKESAKEPLKGQSAKHERNFPSEQGELTFEGRGKHYGMLLQAVMNGKLQSIPWIN